MLALNVNGRTRKVDVDESTPLLWVLRDHLDMTGTKFGCGMALCGACTVHLDGQPIRSCVTPASMAVGKRITTIETIGRTPAAREPALAAAAHDGANTSRRAPVLVKKNSTSRTLRSGSIGTTMPPACSTP